VGCTSCADSTLTSVRRSGYRRQDPPLPPEEVTREFSITLPFGTKSPESFAEAENYEVVSTTDNPLRDRALSCRQGDANDASWNCTKFTVSHIVCGHYGVFTFTYPNYEIAENAGFIRMTVRRTGGGYGNATVTYNIKHYSTNDSDLSATAYYTTSQQLDFSEGVIERSFLISILDDNIVEPNEVFQVILSTPEGGGSVGSQFRANVTIIDDDGERLSAKLTKSFENTTTAMAGTSFTITVIARNGVGELISTGGELFFAALENNFNAWSGGDRRQSSRKTCDVVDSGTGSYSIVCSGLEEQGLYQLRTWHAFPGALLGQYYSDAFFQNLALTRQDHVVNFTWGFGPLIPQATDYVTIRWSGAIFVNQTGLHSFLVNADDQARLWIDGDLVIDHFHERQVNLEPSRSIYLNGNKLYEIVLEYREINGPAFAQLMWKPPYVSNFAVIPQNRLYTLFEIDLSPVEVTIFSAETSPYTTECIGDGLFSAKVLEPAYFSVCPRDIYGNLRNDADPTYISTQIFSANFTLQGNTYHGVGSEIINPVLTFNPATSCWDGYYVPLRAGDYELRIMYQADPDSAHIEVAGSPFFLHVEPDISYGPLSDVTGLPQPLYAEAGSCYNFTVTMRDRYRNLRLQGGDQLQVYMFRVDYFNESIGVEPPGFISPVGSLTMNPTFTPTMAPTTMNNSIYPVFSDSGGDIVRFGLVSDLGNGNYFVRVCPVIAGTYEIHILLGGNGVSNQPNRIMDPAMSYMLPSGMGSYLGQYVAFAPYAMYVRHTYPSVITSTVKGPGLVNGTVGVPAYFLLTVRDPYDNVVRASPYRPNITFFIDETPAAFVSVWDYKNGSYLLEYIPTKAGNNSISVFVNGHRIRYSPFMVPIADGGTSGKYTFAEGVGIREGTTGKTSYFTLFSYDLSGNRKTTLNDVYKFVVESPENITGFLQQCPCPGDSSHPVCDPLEGCGGYYFGSFTPRFTGNAVIHIYLIVNATYSMEISGSPLVPVINPSEPLAEDSDITGTLRNIEAGSVGVVEIQLRDYFGNKLDKGGMMVELGLHCVACDWGTVEPFNDSQAMKNRYNYKGFFYGYPTFYGQVLDKQDGSYQISYLVNKVGQYVMRLSLGEAGLNATYFNDTSFGSLFNQDYSGDSRFLNSLQGSPDSHGLSISWTGDIGGPISSSGDGTVGSYINRYFSRVERNVAFNASRGIKEFFDSTGDELWNSTRMYNMREHYWSARWTGMVVPAHAELYRIIVKHDDHSTVRCWIGGKGIGMNYSSYGELILDTTHQGAKRSIGYYNFSDTNYREIMIEFVHTVGDAALSLWWESLSTPLSIIPPSAFFHWRNMSHHNVTIHPSKLCPHCSTAFGKSLHEARVAQDQSFLIYGRDIFGNLMQKGGDSPSMVAIGTNGVAFRGRLTDYGNSTYRIHYYPTVAGEFRMYVTIGCCVGNVASGLPSELKQRLPLLVFGSPFLLQIAPSVLNSSRSVATGRGVLGGTVNTDLQVVIQYRDIFNNPTTVENISYVVCQVKFVDELNGLEAVPDVLRIAPYTSNVSISYSFKRAGRYRMSMLLGYVNRNLTIVSPAPILSSPFSIVLNPDVAFANKTICRGLGLRQAVAGEEAHFEVQLYDEFGNKLIVGGNKLHIRLEGDSNFTQLQRVFDIAPFCRDDQSGRYLCQYTPLHPGPHQLRMRLLKGDPSHPGGNGLRATYFNNQDGAGFAPGLQISKVLERVEESIEVNGMDGFLIPDNILGSQFTSQNELSMSPVLKLVRMGQSIRWVGYIVAPRTDKYGFQFDQLRNINVTIIVNNRLVYDSEKDITRPIEFVQFAAYSIYVKVSTSVIHGKPLSGRLVWSTASVPVHPISTFFLYTDAEELPLSPYPVVVS
jgi:hypothetical protein